MKRSFFLSLCFLFLLAPTFAQERWQSADHGVSLAPPPGWKAGTPTSEDELGLWEAPDGAAELSVSYSDSDRGPDELDAYMQELATSLEGDGGKFIEAKKVSVGDQEMGIVVVQLDPSGYHMISYTGSVLTEGRVYYVMGICTEDAFPQLKATFESTCRSFVKE